MTEAEVLILLVYLALGALAGIIGGLFGLGGGIVIVPVLLFIYIKQGFHSEILMHLAVATSLATIVFTSMSSTFAHHRRGAVLWQQVGLLVPGIIVGGILGALIADYLPSHVLRVVFGLFELFVAIQIGFGVKPSAQRKLPGKQGMIFTGGGLGTFSTLLGIGGGTLTVPFLLWCNVNIRNAVATSAACGLPIALAGTAAMIFTGWHQQQLPSGATGYVYWPAAIPILISSVLFAPLGAKLMHAMPVDTLKRFFAVVLACVGLRMLF